MARHNIIGEEGENLAVEYLVKLGYIIRDRNWRFSNVELDIIAQANNMLIFVEVKTRTTDFEEELIDKKKINNLTRAANVYIHQYDLPHPVQFDLVVVMMGVDGEYEIEHIPDAFMPNLSSYR
ncbi:MAG: YraN family protein [Bacteroidales bacterium]